MTNDQENEEWRHIYETRLGVLCGSDEPTREQCVMAGNEADEHLKRLEKEE